jgi:hypothetical protein
MLLSMAELTAGADPAVGKLEIEDVALYVHD